MIGNYGYRGYHYLSTEEARGAHIASSCSDNQVQCLRTLLDHCLEQGNEQLAAQTASKLGDVLEARILLAKAEKLASI